MKKGSETIERQKGKRVLLDDVLYGHTSKKTVFDPVNFSVIAISSKREVDYFIGRHGRIN